MITTRRHFVKLVGGAAVAAGAGLDAGPTRAQAAPVKLGVLAIRAGIAAPVGTAGLRGTEWWLERVNKAGGKLDASGFDWRTVLEYDDSGRRA